jgi:hypothetical protein
MKEKINRKKVLYWVVKISSIILLIPVAIIAIPGAILYVISEELEDKQFKKIK